MSEATQTALWEIRKRVWVTGDVQERERESESERERARQTEREGEREKTCAKSRLATGTEARPTTFLFRRLPLAYLDQWTFLPWMILPAFTHFRKVLFEKASVS